MSITRAELDAARTRYQAVDYDYITIFDDLELATVNALLDHSWLGDADNISKIEVSEENPQDDPDLLKEATQKAVIFAVSIGLDSEDEDRLGANASLYEVGITSWVYREARKIGGRNRTAFYLAKKYSNVVLGHICDFVRKIESGGGCGLDGLGINVRPPHEARFIAYPEGDGFLIQGMCRFRVDTDIDVDV